MAASEQEQLFVKWLVDAGADMSKVAWPHFEDGDRMLAATANAKRGEKVFDIPMKCILSPLNLPQDQVFVSFFTTEEKIADKSRITIEYIVFVMKEVLKGNKSWFYPYLSILPKEPQRLQHWTDEELNELQNEELKQHSIKLRENKMAAWIQFLSDCNEKWGVDTTGFTKELFEWTSEMVGTRAHSFASESLKEFGFLSLCPLVDMMNHRDGSMADLRRAGDKFQVWAGTEDVVLGKGIYTMYGAYTDEHLLGHYGFCPDTNMFGTFQIEIRFPGRGDSEVDKMRNEILKSATFNVTGPVSLRLRSPPDDLVKFFRLVAATEIEIRDAGVEGFASLARYPFRHSNEITAHMACAQNIRMELDKLPTTLEHDFAALQAALKNPSSPYRYVQALKYRVSRKKILRRSLRYCDEMSFMPDGAGMYDLDNQAMEEMISDFAQMRGELLIKLYHLRARDVSSSHGPEETLVPGTFAPKPAAVQIGQAM